VSKATVCELPGGEIHVILSAFVFTCYWFVTDGRCRLYLSCALTQLSARDKNNYIANKKLCGILLKPVMR